MNTGDANWLKLTQSEQNQLKAANRLLKLIQVDRDDIKTVSDAVDAIDEKGWISTSKPERESSTPA